MTAIESILEIKSTVSVLARFSPSRDPSVSKKVQAKYLELIDRFFLENENIVEPERQQACLGDMDYFIGIMDGAVEHYNLEVGSE